MRWAEMCRRPQQFKVTRLREEGEEEDGGGGGGCCLVGGMMGSDEGDEFGAVALCTEARLWRALWLLAKHGGL